MKNIKLYIGCNVKGVPTHSMESVCAILASSELENATITQGYGFYKGELEQTVIITVCNVTDEQSRYIEFDLRYMLKNQLEQECIGFEVYESTFTWE